MSGIVCVLNNYEDDDDQEKVFYGMIGSYLFVYFSVVSLVLFSISSFLMKMLFSGFFKFISVIFLVLFLTEIIAICVHHSKSLASCQKEFNHQRTKIQRFLNEII